MTVYKRQFLGDYFKDHKQLEKKHIELDNTRLPSNLAVKTDSTVFVPIPLETEVTPPKESIQTASEELSDDTNATITEDIAVTTKPSAEELCQLKCRELLEQAKAQAQMIINNAQKEAEELKSKTEIECDNLKKVTQNECQKLYEDAEAQIKSTLELRQSEIEQQTRAELQARFEPIFQTLVEAAALIGPTLNKWMNAQEEQLVKLAVALAKKILKQELSADPEKYLHLINQALPLLYGEAEIKLFVNSNIMRIITTDPVFVQKFERLKLEYPELVILEDNTITEGFRLQGPIIKYDYDLTRILDEAEAALVRQSLASKASLDAENP